MEKLNHYERTIIQVMLQAHKEGLVDLTEPFKARDVAGMIADVPTRKHKKYIGTPRNLRVPNVYKMNYLLKKSQMFDWEKDKFRSNLWVLKPEYM